MSFYEAVTWSNLPPRPRISNSGEGSTPHHGVVLSALLVYRVNNSVLRITVINSRDRNNTNQNFFIKLSAYFCDKYK
jgi:hypothetical protein